jgi:predicted glycogen debranching enzyme
VRKLSQPILDRSICGDLSAAKTREWLETNGLGSYASSTILGLNTRRYHGLLVAATQPPAGRMVLLSKMEETVVVGTSRYDLSTNRYPGAIHPAGYQFLKQFRLDPFPTFVYDLDGLQVEKRVFMVHGRNRLVIEYECRNGTERPRPEWALELRPLIAFRDFHSMTRRNDLINPAFTMEAGTVRLAPYPGVPPLYLAFGDARIEATGYWYFNFEYEIECERGFDEKEDLFNHLVARYSLGPGASVSVIASLEGSQECDTSVLRRREIERRVALRGSAHRADPFIASLMTAADQFIVRRSGLDTIIAGYHWFGDWGRDTMIALPGLTLATGRVDVARGVLETFARHVDRGMLPNRFPDNSGSPEYNTVDATLWMFEAVRAFVAQTDDWAFVDARLYDILADIIEWQRRGTRFGIKVDVDGLLAAGVGGSQLTWMDARVGDVEVTPRCGKPVEIQALWYNALRIMESFSRRRGHAQQADGYAGMAEQAAASFNAAFWNDSDDCLYDVIDREMRDGSLRPNQILAVSLPHSMLESRRAKAVVAVVERELFTPRGLRSLAKGDPRYRARYVGTPAERDGAYHQGTVWPWLLGAFFTAWLKVHGADDVSRATVHGWLSEIDEHLSEAGLGQISEIFDGDAPHQPRGCIAQAWSVAELLRVAMDVTPLDATRVKTRVTGRRTGRHS